jgi:membrane fusion protein, multidrug efflux system
MQRMMKAETTFTPAPTAPGQNGNQNPPEGGEHRSFWILWLVVICVLVGISALVVYRLKTAQSASTSGGRRLGLAGPIPVDAVASERGDLPIYIDGLLGTVTSLQTVTINTRVDGQLIKVAFVEGQIVHQGDLLAQIDPNPYEAQLEVAQGQLAKDEASLKDAQLDLNRYKQAPLAYTQQQIDTQQALVEQDAGIVKSDQGSVDSAKVNLDYCTITSPVTGRVGLRLVDVGNIVNTTDTTGLVVLTQLQPITVEFPIVQANIPDVITHSDKIPPLETTALDGDHVLSTGKLASIDSQVDITTGMVKLKALFDNTKNELFPNQLLTIRLKVTTLRNAVLVPSEAVQTGPDFSFVYVIKSDNTVEVRKIKPGQDEIVNGQDITAIDDGLAPKELVVTNGVDQLKAGSKVDPTIRTMAQPTTRTSTSRPSGHVRRALTNDSDSQNTPRTGE